MQMLPWLLMQGGAYGEAVLASSSLLLFQIPRQPAVCGLQFAAQRVSMLPRTLVTYPSEAAQHH